MKVWKKSLAIVLFMVVSVCGCTKQNANLNVSKEDTIQIGMSFDSLVIERWIRDRDAFTKCVKDMKAEVNVQNANGDFKEQIKQIEYFIDQNVDVIVIIPVDCGQLSNVIEKAHKQGIKIISYDRLIQNADVDLYISSDNKMVGTLMAESLVEHIQNGGNIVEILGSKVDNNVSMLEEGFNTVIKKSSLSVVYKSYCDNWEADEAIDYLEEALSQNSDISGIMCGNDDIATRVCQVLSEHRLAGSVVVVGQDADLSACQRIVEGIQEMTVFKKCENMAEIAAQFAMQLAKDEDITSKDSKYVINDTISDGSYNIPYYKLDSVAVTKENIDQVIIQSGFHDKGDVYLNIMSEDE